MLRRLIPALLCVASLIPSSKLLAISSTTDDCAAFDQLAKQVLVTAQNLRDSGAYRTSDSAINLLAGSNQLLANCQGLESTKFQIKSDLVKALVDLNRLEEASQLIADFPSSLLQENLKFNGEHQALQAYYYQAAGNPDKSIELANNALQTGMEVRNASSVAEALWLLGSLSEGASDYESAIDYYQRSANVGELKGIQADYIVESLIHIGNVSYQLEDFDLALEYYELGLAKSEEYGIGRLVPFARYHLGKYYHDVGGNSELALVHLERGIESARTHLENYFITPLLLQKSGVIYFELGELERARLQLSEAVELAERNNLARMIPSAHDYLEKIGDQ